MNTEVSIERLSEYQADDARGISRLLGMLSNRFKGEVVPEDLLRQIIESPWHDQLVARIDAHIVGAATLSVVLGSGAGAMGYLQDFVVDTEVRRKGVGNALWQEVLRWCEEKEVELEFTSHPSREAAQQFYLKNGAIIRHTNVFHVPLRQDK